MLRCVLKLRFMYLPTGAPGYQGPTGRSGPPGVKGQTGPRGLPGMYYFVSVLFSNDTPYSIFASFNFAAF